MSISLTAGVMNRDLYLKRMRIFTAEVTVYPVSCEVLANGRTDLQWLEEVLLGGARIVQLRDKVSADHVLLEKAYHFRRMTRGAGALFIVNDRVDIALKAEADGVHVGQSDMSAEEVRRLAPDMIIGLSCNTLEQVQDLELMVSQGKSPVSYFNIGPLFATGTKEGLKNFLGSEAVPDFSSRCSLPFTVMGGIKFNHIKSLCGLGARRIAVVTALSRAPDIKAETRKWVDEISTHSSTAG